MNANELLDDLVSRWRDGAEAGRRATAAELCPDRPDLLPELERRLRACEHIERLALQVDTSSSGVAPTHISTTPPSAADPGDLAALQPAGDGGGIGRLGRFRVLEVLGRGGMGVVFRAEDTMLRRPVAVKLLKKHLAAEPVSRERFLREARSAARLEHPHVVAIHHVDESAGVPYLVMPLLRGESLERRLKGEPRPALLFVLRVARQMAAGLAAAHAAGLVHRDVKPANVWLREPDDAVVLLDFGLARADQGETALTRSGDVLGTPAYMAPEQADARPVDHRADLFSFGCVLYEMVSGQRPYAAKTQLALVKQLATYTPPPVDQVAPGLPDGLAALIDRLTAKDPADRPVSTAEVEATLGDIERRLQPVPAAGRSWYQISLLLGAGLALVFALVALARTFAL